MSQYTESLDKIDQRMAESINFMAEMASGRVPFPDEETTEQCQAALRELKQVSAQLQTVRRGCAEAADQAAYLAQPHIKKVYEFADALATETLACADRGYAAVESFQQAEQEQNRQPGLS